MVPAMSDISFSLLALSALVPAALVPYRANHKGDGVLWTALIVTVAGPAAWTLVQMSGTWRTGLSSALWVTITATAAVFLATAVTARPAWRLTPLMAPVLLVLGVIAVIWQQAPAQHPLSASAPSGWIQVHIAVSVLTYALVTIAAVAAFGAFLQERALKRKQTTRLTRLLPPVLDCEDLSVRLLFLGEAVLAAGLATGMAVQFRESGTLLVADHKTILSLTAFAVIGGLLIANRVSGVRGRRAARLVLLGYLLLTLGYPGVKFVTDVLIGG